MKDAKGHGSNPRGAHQAGVAAVGQAPLTWYHGSAADFSAFELGHGASASRNGVWLTTDPTVATDYARIAARGGGSPLLYEAGINGNFATQKHWDDAEASLSPTAGTRFSFEHDAKIIGKLKDAGFDGVRFGASVFMFDPGKISIRKKGPVK